MTRRARHLSLSRRDLARGTAGLLTGVLAGRAGAADWLGFDGAPHSRAIRRELWSWTTPDQAHELQQTGALLTRSESPTLGRGYAMKYLETLGADPLARLLLTPRFAKGRYAWVNPWATCMGFGSEDYGGELLRIELRSEGWMARIFAGAGQVTAVDFAGREVPVDQVLAAPQRLAGFYFVSESRWAGSTAESSHCDPSYRGESAYRELYVGNEAQVARWTLRAAPIAARLEQDIARLARFGRQLEAAAAAPLDECRWMLRTRSRAWNAPPWTLREEYESALAFLSSAYLPEAPRVNAIVEKLKSRLFTPALR